MAMGLFNVTEYVGLIKVGMQDAVAFALNGTNPQGGDAIEFCPLGSKTFNHICEKA